MSKYIMSSILLGFSLFFLSGCEKEEQCLAHGENCSSSYIDANYGGNRPPCCNSSDQCQTSPGGYLTCN